MQVKMDKEDVIISFEKDFSDVIEYLGAKKGIIKTTVPYLYNGIWTYLLYEIAYYELDLNHIYSTFELDALVKTGKVVLLSSKPYICAEKSEILKEECEYAKEHLNTLENYNLYKYKKNGEINNNLVLGMIKKYSEVLSEKCKNREKQLVKK